MVFIPGSNNGVDMLSGVAPGMARGNPVITNSFGSACGIGSCGFGIKVKRTSVKRGSKRRSLIKGKVNISNIPNRIKTLEKKNQILKKKPMNDTSGAPSLSSYQIEINKKKIKELKNMRQSTKQSRGRKSKKISKTRLRSLYKQRMRSFGVKPKRNARSKHKSKRISKKSKSASKPRRRRCAFSCGNKSDWKCGDVYYCNSCKNRFEKLGTFKVQNKTCEKLNF